MTLVTDDSRLPSLFAHTTRKDWGVGVLAWEAGGKRGYLFLCWGKHPVVTKTIWGNPLWAGRGRIYGESYEEWVSDRMRYG